MSLWIAQTVIALASGYFVVFGVIALFSPAHAKRFLLGFADTAAKHYLELAIRLAIGFALLELAPVSQSNIVLRAFGWILITTTVLLALLPWRIHQRFAAKSVQQALQYMSLIGLASVAISALLIWTLLVTLK